jgi:hypothetical protein
MRLIRKLGAAFLITFGERLRGAALPLTPFGSDLMK